ncbi:MAG: carboxypeptidase-like regulatory domain-containing protein [Caldilineaceae bacterium]
MFLFHTINISKTLSIVHSYQTVGSLVVVSVVALLWFFNQSFVGSLASAAPFTPGSISGRVTNEAGEPIGNRAVHLFSYPFITTTNGYPAPNFTSETILTDGDGRYSFPFVAPGDYRIHMYDPYHSYAGQYYKNASLLEDAVTLKVRGNPYEY